MLRRAVFSLVLVLGLIAWGACEEKLQPPKTPADQTYTFRAQVTGLPTPKQALSLHHEAIPDFVGQDGTKIGMDEMEMEFPFLAPAAKLDGILVDDKVEVTLEMRWKSQPRYLLTAIRKLPKDTVLSIHLLAPEK
jgi:hypothetical protein